MKNSSLSVLLLAGLLTIQARAQTSFTYQGRLTENTTAANGSFDFEFRLFSAANGGVQVGSVLSRENIGVTNGLFAVALDFGANAFPGADRFLAISVRPGASVGAFSGLTPRQQVTPAPYAITAASFSGAVTSGQLSGAYANPVTFNNAGNSFTGSGAGLTDVNASQLNGLPGAFYLDAGNLIAGTLPAERLADHAITGIKIQDGTISNDDIDPLANIDPAKIGLGNVNFPEFDALDGANGPLQAQINERLATTGGPMTGPISFSGTGPGLQFPAVGAGASPMMYLFTGGTGNGLRTVIGHSPQYPTWGLAYEDQSDRFLFQSEGANVLVVDLGFSKQSVGVGRIPGVNRFEVEGNASKSVAGDWLANSDRRIKEDIRPLTNALETINRVRPVGFHYTDEYLAEHPGIPDTEYFNVLAQEFAEVFPDAVQAGGDQLSNGDKVLQVDTYPATIYSIAAIQELDRELKARDARINALERTVAELAATLKHLREQPVR